VIFCTFPDALSCADTWEKAQKKKQLGVDVRRDVTLI
jgi:hypothetical protein